MNGSTEFKRLQFFTGFFTTARDWNDGQDYHLEKRKLHNRGLHTPGVLRGLGQSFRVEAAGGLNVRVLPGAAISGNGEDIYLGQPRTLAVPPGDTLPQLFYISIAYDEQDADYVRNMEAPQYSGHTRRSEVPALRVTTEQPDNSTSLELARIDLQPGVTDLLDAVDPDVPVGNEIDLRHRIWAGAVAAVEPALEPAFVERFVQLMQDTRRDFSDVDRRFPVPPASDVRSASLTLELLARVNSLDAEQIPDVLSVVAAIEQDLAQEIVVAYPILNTTVEYQAYQDTMTTLLNGLRDGIALDSLLTRQKDVAEAARELSEVVIQAPVVDAGTDHTILATGGQGTVVLDASNVQSFGGREIVSYRWEKTQ